MWLYTYPDFVYERIMLHTTNVYITFTVRTCEDAHIGLFELVGDDRFYEIVIGGYANSRSDIRKQPLSGVVAYAETPYICNCDEYLPFWVSWSQGSIRLGTGTLPGVADIMHYNDDNPYKVKVVALYSWHNHPGRWMLPQKTGM